MTATAGESDCIALRALRFAYRGGEFTLAVPELSIARGAKVALVGPSGCGKSTLLHLMAGILVATQGDVVTFGTDWRRLGEAERRRRRIARIGLVFQEFELLEHLSVRENILLPYYINRALRIDAAVRDRLGELASATGIDALLARRPRALSQGERQRVAICRALITRPELILADEPTGNLDPDTAKRVLELLLREVDRVPATLVMVTHDHGLVGAFDRVVDGRGFADGAAQPEVCA